ncbi:hypothetical protein NECAME_01897 [Necator americanus]|uniref:Uncharacterized protein n=1 Tax=Necator americanus TaxID=51031 RepID=W2TNM2_NECAM|nr:hypothetical protein NECAME_01897 [Necator americanus]ETN82612.1 hypothetical protein NECAME_01897 [Necator americanus]
MADQLKKRIGDFYFALHPGCPTENLRRKHYCVIAQSSDAVPGSVGVASSVIVVLSDVWFLAVYCSGSTVCASDQKSGWATDFQV